MKQKFCVLRLESRLCSELKYAPQTDRDDPVVGALHVQ